MATIILIITLIFLLITVAILWTVFFTQNQRTNKLLLITVVLLAIVVVFGPATYTYLTPGKFDNQGSIYWLPLLFLESLGVIFLPSFLLSGIVGVIAALGSRTIFKRQNYLKIGIFAGVCVLLIALSLGFLFAISLFQVG